MPLEIRRDPKESSQNLVRRFSQRVKKSGILLRARKLRFKTREKSRNLKKRSALRRKSLRQEYEKLAKLGKRPE